MPFDNQIKVALPEGAEIELTPAGLGIRVMAFAVDMLIRIVCFIAIALLVGQLGQFGSGILLLSWFLLEWFYPVIFEVFLGATPGKRIYKIKVVQDNGLNISFAGSLTRNLFRAIDFLPFAYIFGAVTLVLNQKFQRLGDIVAGTLVIYEPENRFYNTSSDDRNIKITVPLTLKEQGAILSFNERMESFTTERADELAHLIADIFPDSDLSDREKIQILAAQIIGKS